MTDIDKQSRRRFMQATTGVSTAALIGLAGCTGGNGSGSGSTSSSSGEQGSGKTKFWSSPNKKELEFHKNARKSFIENNDVSLDVRPVPEGDSSEQVVLSALASGTEPAAFANVFPGFAAKLQENNAAKNLYDIDGAKSFLTERCGETILKRYEAPDGGLYQAPWKANPVLFQYNDTVFKEAGFKNPDDYPTTLSGVLDAGKKIVDQGAAKVLWDRAPRPTWYERWFDFLPLYLAASKGEASMFEQGSESVKPAFNNKTAKTVLQFFQDMYSAKLAPTQGSEQPKFPNNEAAINTGGPWVIPYFTDVNKDLEMSHMNPPVPDGVSPNSHTYADPKNTSIFASAKNAKGTWNFVQFEQQKEWDTKFLEKTLQLPLRKGLVDAASGFFEENPGIKPYAEALETSHPPAYTPNYSKVMNIFGEECFVPVALGNKAPQKGLDAAEKAIKQELN
ncbi:multiple sugar transport system substrate-binding protein [Halogranum amylolyticum]|uniref:Multiple sugar transport system substrate-binding protein n=1 Tax=Halogranum amylolyticum TaxID=660520 RepID=A0A1H8VKW8_9EURY|nr:extracellular solute-binding protein [Halogranum amylolyticum]SEP16092.1 multiple sugar transport system substrate-binding protein [Halogranum amylolyticum]